jgi:ferric-chelate reductase
LLHHFSYLLAQSNSKLYYTSLQISVSYTRCFANPPAHVLKALQHLPAGLRVTPGRPKLQSTLNSVVDRACALFHRGMEGGGRGKGAPSGPDGKSAGGRPAGVFVTVCGPQGLAEDVRKAVRAVEPDRRKRAGGVELFDEYVPVLIVSETSG